MSTFNNCTFITPPGHHQYQSTTMDDSPNILDLVSSPDPSPDKNDIPLFKTEIKTERKTDAALAESARFLDFPDLEFPDDDLMELFPRKGRNCPIPCLQLLGSTTVSMHKSVSAASKSLVEDPGFSNTGQLKYTAIRREISRAIQNGNEFGGFKWVSALTAELQSVQSPMGASSEEDFTTSVRLPVTRRQASTRTSANTEFYSPPRAAKRRISSRPRYFTVGVESSKCFGHRSQREDQLAVTLIGCACSDQGKEIKHCMACMNHWFSTSQNRKCLNCNTEYSGYKFLPAPTVE